jgi:hypothetical protein
MNEPRKLEDCWTMIGSWAIVLVTAAFSLAPVFV